MYISEIIDRIKNYSRGLDQHGSPIQEETTRDKVLYGNTDKECTGIITTCFASVEVIQRAHELGCNLIIPHEALFWNHGDHTKWLEDESNTVFLRKKALLDEYGITVWRNHDYIHSGLPDGKGGWYDGIFRGFLEYTGLLPYYVYEGQTVKYSGMPIKIKVPNFTVKQLANMIMEGANLRGIRLIGNPETVVSNLAIPMHCLGFQDNEIITSLEKNRIDCIMTMELIDYTVNEYMRDGMMLKDNKAILAVGHFNLEEPGMKYMLNWLPEALGTNDVPMHFVQSGDTNRFILR